jgi:hypothetical protein
MFKVGDKVRINDNRKECERINLPSKFMGTEITIAKIHKGYGDEIFYSFFESPGNAWDVSVDLLEPLKINWRERLK